MNNGKNGVSDTLRAENTLIINSIFWGLSGVDGYGMVEKAVIPPQSGEQTAQLWQWLANSSKSRYIEFVKDAHYTGNWDTPLIAKMVPQIISRLNNKKILI